MKNKLTFLLGCVVMLLATSSSNYLADDNCTAYVPSKEGTVLSYKNYNSKDKLESRDEITVISVKDIGGETQFTLGMKTWDKKDENIHEGEFTYTCKDGVFKISMESMMDKSMMEAYNDMEIEIKQKEIKLPSSLTAGMSLPDASMVMDVSTNGMKIMSMKFDIVNRKVEKIESITTEAGTFECAKVTSTQKMKTGFINKTYYSIDWIAEDVGSVRSESYDDKMKLSNYRVLTNLAE
jgi:hypothetical protein